MITFGMRCKSALMGKMAMGLASGICVSRAGLRPGRTMNLRQRHSIPAIWAARTPGRGAFTLIELMVAVAILAVMIVIFSGILSQVQRVMNKSNDAIRTDRIVVAVDKLLRRDIASISRSGFLKITTGQQIAFTGVGSFESPVAGGVTANAAIIDYGCLNPGNNGILWRRQHLLKPEEVQPPPRPADALEASLAESTTVASTTYTDPAVISIPPTGPADWMNYVGGPCTQFQVFWWNGTIWSAADASGEWTASSNWPEALRIRYTLEGKLFEIIANIE